MIRRTIALVVTVVATLCACASRGDVLRTHNFILAQAYAVPHGRMFAMTAAVLEAEGYIVGRRDSAETEGWLGTEPRFTAPSCFKPEARAEVEQLGLGLRPTARTRSKHDSTEVRGRVRRTSGQHGRPGLSVGLLRRVPPDKAVLWARPGPSPARWSASC